ncbi:fork head domain-containing protein FD5-like [Toxorhynchites rutilus septentrionalis]|uniref:fork head domain-containing protein FD5-like n=1 Tax=Toxorhynchites rutilus septentrionalis TaxID=329112 RepID=UPI0024796B25|nr:fork head domain-containing protein FD5-like [Toxorhynchites rutilus septentrionalis]
MLNCADLVQFDQYSLQLYNYAMVERFRTNQFFNYGNIVADPRTLSRFFKPSVYVNNPAEVGPSALLADASKLASAPKPQYSYIGLIAIAILSSPERKLVLSDIYQHILDNYSYFRSRGPGWRNSIRHNLSLNDCFIKAGRSAHGKGHYWAVHPANVDDFLKGDFRRRKAQRKVRRHMGLTSDDDIFDNSSPRQFFPAIPSSPVMNPAAYMPTATEPLNQAAAAAAAVCVYPTTVEQQHAIIKGAMENFSRKRQFDVESLLRPDDANSPPSTASQEPPEKKFRLAEVSTIVLPPLTHHSHPLAAFGTLAGLPKMLPKQT